MILQQREYFNFIGPHYVRVGHGPRGEDHDIHDDQVDVRHSENHDHVIVTHAIVS